MALDESMADDSGELALRPRTSGLPEVRMKLSGASRVNKPDLRSPVRFLLVEHLDVAQVTGGVARPPDAVRVGWI